jgi:hypothetical protein
MPLQHVLETARKLGIPVVITDEAGDAAQVVMPFDDFAAMVNATSPTSPKTRKAPPSEPRTIPIRDEREDEIDLALEELQFQGIREEPLVRENPVKVPPAETPKDGEFLEDKFYLEPLNDEESLK